MSLIYLIIFFFFYTCINIVWSGLCHHIEGKWVLGFIENGSEDVPLEVCPNNIRSALVLFPLILKHVEIGTSTTIHTDNWEAYDCLSEHGFIHKKITWMIYFFTQKIHLSIKWGSTGTPLHSTSTRWGSYPKNNVPMESCKKLY